MKTKIFLMLLLISSISFSQDVTIPDAAFKAALVNNFSINANMDAEIQVTEAIAYSGQINVSNLSISNLIGIEEFVNITSLNFENNSVSSVDLTSNIAITTLDMDNNNIVLTDLSTLTSLQFLYASQNPWDYLDVSSNSQLFALEAKNSTTMSSLNVANGNNPGLFLFDVTNNPNLSCIQADASTVNTPPSGWLKDATATYNLNCPVFCNIDIPDANFKAFLLSFGHDLNNDGEVQCDEALLFTGDLIIPTNGIISLTGIEALVNIVRVTSFNNPISGVVDLSGLSQLVQLRIFNSSVDAVTLGSHPSLSSIDLVNGNLSTIDLSGCPILSVLAINNNPLTFIDLSQNLSLIGLNVTNTLLTSLDFSANTSLQYINAQNASVAGSVDFSANTALTTIRVTNNNITELNVANGNNINFSVLDARTNPNLTCIEVDDRVYSQNNWTLIDAQTSFSEDCVAFACTINIPDANFKSELVNNSSINLNGDGEIQCIEASSYTGTISVGGKSIVDMTGIEEFVNITGLIAFANQIVNLDLRTNTALTTLFVNNNQLLVLNVANGNNLAITTFNATSNPTLMCIEVDDAVWSTTNWTNIDAIASFNENCPTCANTATYTSSGWVPAAPTTNTSVVISSDYNTSVVGSSIEACEIKIDAGIILTIAAGDYLQVANNIIVDGTLDVLHEGSVVQLDDLATVTNNGTINVRKTTPNLGVQDFMILGSPMTAESTTGVYTTANRVLNHFTGNFVPHSGIASGTENFADDNGDNWAIHSGTLTPGEGYLVKPQSNAFPSGTYDLNYTLGTLNNGAINHTLLYNGTRNASPNMLGNPYASAIDNDAFLAANALVDAIYYWEHITPPSNTYPGFNQFNFNMGDISVYNQGSGGVASANGGTVPSQFMASGQGFAVKALGVGSVVFNNSMRVLGPNTDYRNPENNDRQRIWLDLNNETYGLSSNMLIAFTENASNEFESKYDSRRLDTPISMYSIIETGETLAIQGRTAFNEEQEVILGFSTQIEENQNYTISIRDLEGELISNAMVYLEDKLLNVITNISEENYSFTSNQGNFEDRFILLFKDRVLEINDTVLSSIQVYPVPSQNTITIANPKSLELQKATIYDLSGRVLKIINLNGNSSDKNIDISNLATANYILKIDGLQGSIIKRIIKN